MALPIRTMSTKSTYNPANFRLAKKSIYWDIDFSYVIVMQKHENTTKTSWKQIKAIELMLTQFDQLNCKKYGFRCVFFSEFFVHLV